MGNKQIRTNLLCLAVATAGLLTAACGSGESAEPAAHKKDMADTASSFQLSTSGKLAAPSKATDAYTYDTKLAPAGAELAVEVKSAGDSSTFVLTATGLRPNRGYGAHAHVAECGSNGDLAGGHFQHHVSPTPDKPNPKYNNPQNEIWLDLQTDAKGNGTSTATVDYLVTDSKRPKSVVIHAAKKTGTEGDMAGEAGDRIACLTIPSHS